MWPRVRLLASALGSCALVVLLGTAASADPPVPVPASPGSVVNAWTCTLRTSPAPTTVPSPSPAIPAPVMVPSPTTSPVPGGQDCAATDYAPPALVSSPGPSAGTGGGMSGCLVPGESASASPTAGSPSPSPSPSSSASASAWSCVVRLENGQAFGLWLFLGSILLVGLTALLVKLGRAFRG